MVTAALGPLPGRAGRGRRCRGRAKPGRAVEGLGDQLASSQRRIGRPDARGELAEREDLAEGRRALLEQPGAVGGPAVSTTSASSMSAPVTSRLRNADVSVPHRANSASMVSLTGSASKPSVPALLTSTPESAPSSWRARSSRYGERQMFAVHTKRMRIGRPPSGGAARRPRCTRLAQGPEHLVAAVLDRATGGVDAQVGVGRLLVGRGDAREVRDLAASRLGVEALPVAALALLERGRDVHEEERAAGGLGHRLGRPARGVEGRDRAAHGDAAVSGDLGRDPADAADVGLAVLAAERRPADRFRRTTSPSRLVTVRSPASSRASITAWATVDLPLPDRPVKNSTSPRRSADGWSARRSRRCRRGSRRRRPRARAPGRSRRTPPRHAMPSSWSTRGRRGTASGTATTEAPGTARAAAASEARRSATGDSSGVPGPVSASSTTGSADGAQTRELGLGECVDDRRRRSRRRAGRGSGPA